MSSEALERLDQEQSDLSSIERAADDLSSTTASARDGLLEALRKAAEAKREIENLTRQATAWSPGPGELRKVDEELDESATDIAKHFTQAEATAQQVCAAPSLGPAHPAAKKAMKKVFGDCTKQEFVPLRQAVVSACKRSLTKCYEADSCSTLRDKRDMFEQCRDARKALRDRCYSSQCDGHDTAINEADVGRLNCGELMTRKGC